MVNQVTLEGICGLGIGLLATVVTVGAAVNSYAYFMGLDKFEHNPVGGVIYGALFLAAGVISIASYSSAIQDFKDC